MKRFENIIAVINGVGKAFVFLSMVGIFIPIAVVYKYADPQHPFKIPQIFHYLLVRLLGIHVRVSGTPSTMSPVMFVANHASYLDIPVLASLLPAAFVAKAEVAAWPFFGFLAKIQNTLFIERRSTRVADQRTQLQDHLAKRQDLVLFPEGTSSDGLGVLPFKSSLFSIVEDSSREVAITVQPISVTCTELNGLPLSRAQRPLYAWYGDMTLPPHLWNVFKRGHFTVDVVFHPTLQVAEHLNRKALAATCQDTVGRGIEQSLAELGLAERALEKSKEI